MLPDWAVPLLAEEVCPTIGGGGSAGPLGIGRVPELEPRATRPRVTQRGEISPLFDLALGGRGAGRHRHHSRGRRKSMK